MMQGTLRAGAKPVTEQLSLDPQSTLLGSIASGSRGRRRGLSLTVALRLGLHAASSIRRSGTGNSTTSANGPGTR